jgi:DNA primase
MIDQFGNVIAFSGRRIDGGKEQKYLNTKETDVFTKGKTFFNINNLKKLKNEKGLDSIIIVEGHLDVISLCQSGVQNVVASMGTALTKDQARILKRYSDKIFTCFDGDSAGQKATVRGLEILTEEGLDVKVVSLPDGMDPDDLVKSQGAEGVRKTLLEAKPLIDFKLDLLKSVYDPSTIDGKRKYVVQAIKVIKESASAAEQEDLLKTVRDVTGITFEALQRELYSTSDDTSLEKPQELMQFTDNVGDKTALASRFVLASYLFNKPFASELNIDSVEFVFPSHQAIKTYIKECIAEGKRAKFSDLYEVLGEDKGADEELSRIAGLETDENKSFDQATYFFDCVKTLKLDKLNRDFDNLTKMFEKETDNEKRRTYAQEMARILAEKNKLR